jgi:ribosomal protein S18 acetylase RimI-like enzyme
VVESCRIEINNHAVANLYQMWVAPSHRRIGIGQMLLEKVIAWARAKDATYLDLSVTFDDSPAMRLYTRTGFMPVGEPQLFRQDSELLGQAMRLKLKRSAS